MTTTEMTAIRNLWNDLTAGEQTRSGREMALSAHRLNRDASIATEPNGAKWDWNEGRALWVKRA